MTRLLASIALALSLLTAPNIAHAAAIKITVNSTEITDLQISGRAALIALERRGNSNSARLQLAQDELIDEALMREEANRLGIQVTDAQVDAAYTNVARSLNVSVTNLDLILNRSGVPSETLRDRMRSQLAWQGVTQNAVVPRVQISDLELEEKAAGELTETSNFDYILKEVRFIVPKSSNSSASRRTGEANQYRSNFQGCDSAVELSLSYTDAAVIDLGRRHATQLPEAMAAELAALDVGGITKPRVTETGVSMLAICSKSAARDLTFVKGDLRQEVGTAKLQEEAAAYLERLKERASINRN